MNAKRMALAAAILASGFVLTDVALGQNRRGYFGENNPTYYYGRSPTAYYRTPQPAPYAARPYPYYAPYQYGVPALQTPGFQGIAVPNTVYPNAYPNLVAPRVLLAPPERTYFKY
jgi:hypothetical protein